MASRGGFSDAPDAGPAAPGPAAPGPEAPGPMAGLEGLEGFKRAAEDEDAEGADASLMPPPKVRKAPRRAEIGEDLPDEVSKADIDRMLDQADDIHIENEHLNESSLKRMVLQLQRKIKTNQEMRIKFVDDPEKFLKTEVDLDEEVKRITALTTHPELYGEFVRLGALPSLVGLLNHANTDIAVDVFEVLSEITDPDALGEVEEPEAFVQALFDAQLCTMTVDVLMRIDEAASEEDAKAVTNCLHMIENLADVSPNESCKRFAQVPKLLPWLIKRVRVQGEVDYNRVYASEILGILMQSSEECREAMSKAEGVDKLLRGIAVYRKKDPEGSEESEFMQNMFDCLCSLMLLPENQVNFGKVQGIELMIRMIKERNFATAHALRLADHAMRHCPANCQIFVDKLGLKVLFAMFMKKGAKAKTRSALRDAEEHVTSIIQSLCRYCTGTAVARVLNKFTETQFEKLERLLEMHDEYARSVREADEDRIKGNFKKIDRDLEVNEEEQLFLDRCDAGLFTLQQVDIILVRLANMGNRQVADEINKLLDIKGVSLQGVLDTLAEYLQHLDDSAKQEKTELKNYCRNCAKRAALPAMDAFEDKKVAEPEPLSVVSRPEKKRREDKPDADSPPRRDGRRTDEKERSAKDEPRAKEAKKEKKEKKKDRDRG